MASRSTKGILGVKKDPKNQILFSFNVRDGEEWPSDEDDSDYDPDASSDADEQNEGSRPKRKIKKQAEGKEPVKRKKRATSDAKDVKESEPCKAFKGQIPALPVEIWETIFEYVIAEDGAIPFLFKIAPSVCKLWKQISKKPRLWKKLDLSFGWLKMSDKTFQNFCQRQLGECCEINLTGSKLLAKSENIQAISENCPQLTRINLAYCNKLPQDSVNVLLKGCKHLSDIDLTATTADSVSRSTLCNVATTCSGNLTRLVISNNAIKGFSTMFDSIMKNCPNLQHLDMSNVRFPTTFSIDIEKFQASCPKLKVLGLANSIFVVSANNARAGEMSPGFCHLEELSLAVTVDVQATVIVESVILRLLKGATKLRLLDLRGCRSRSAISCIQDIEAANLEQLYLGRSAVDSCHELPHILNKWRHSLTDLDLSWSIFRGDILSDTIQAITSGDSGKCVLRNLNMAGTNISMEMVQNLVKHLPNIHSLDLTSCRNVTRGCKREYKSKKDLLSLKSSFYKT